MNSMRIPGLPSLVFIFVLLIVLPLAARRSAGRMQHHDRQAQAGARLQYWRSAIMFQLVLFVVAWIVASTFDYPIFSVRGIDLMDVVLSSLALAACLALRWISRLTRSEAELGNLVVYRRAPRSRDEVFAFSAAVLAGLRSPQIASSGRQSTSQRATKFSFSASFTA